MRIQVLRLLADRLQSLASSSAPDRDDGDAGKVAIERDYRRVDEDAVWLSLLWGRKRGGLTLPSGRNRRLLFIGDCLWLGPRPLILLLPALFLVAGTWWAYHPREPQIDRIALDVGIAQYHDPSYYAANADVLFPIWCYRVTQLLLNRFISLDPPAGRAQSIAGAISRGAAGEYGLVAGAGQVLNSSARQITPQPAMSAWRFAVSGDSRNCGDIVMPAIAKKVLNSGAGFYWHLGDFRAIYRVDEDMSAPAALGLGNQPLSLADYQKQAWPDFVEHQLGPFGSLPVYLIMGNHEAIPPMTREAWLIQFSNWLTTPTLRAQRQKDKFSDQKLHPYYHWVQNNVDFISLDNSTVGQFDADQMKWLLAVLARDEASPAIRAIIVGMHEALPGSISNTHSMSESLAGDKSGREAYEALWKAYASAHKKVYLLASHSHYYMDHIFETSDWTDKVLPGWIIGTAGAQRYKLPPEVTPAQHAMTNVYGVMIGTVTQDGTVSFEFQSLALADLSAANEGKQPAPLISWCFESNKQ